MPVKPLKLNFSRVAKKGSKSSEESTSNLDITQSSVNETIDAINQLQAGGRVNEGVTGSIFDKNGRNSPRITRASILREGVNAQQRTSGGANGSSPLNASTILSVKIVSPSPLPVTIVGYKGGGSASSFSPLPNGGSGRKETSKSPPLFNERRFSGYMDSRVVGEQMAIGLKPLFTLTATRGSGRKFKDSGLDEALVEETKTSKSKRVPKEGDMDFMGFSRFSKKEILTIDKSFKELEKSVPLFGRAITKVAGMLGFGIAQTGGNWVRERLSSSKTSTDDFFQRYIHKDTGEEIPARAIRGAGIGRIYSDVVNTGTAFSSSSGSNEQVFSDVFKGANLLKGGLVLAATALAAYEKFVLTNARDAMFQYKQEQNRSTTYGVSRETRLRQEYAMNELGWGGSSNIFKQRQILGSSDPNSIATSSFSTALIQATGNSEALSYANRVGNYSKEGFANPAEMISKTIIPFMKSSGLFASDTGNIAAIKESFIGLMTPFIGQEMAVLAATMNQAGLDALSSVGSATNFGIKVAKEDQPAFRRNLNKNYRDRTSINTNLTAAEAKFGAWRRNFSDIDTLNSALLGIEAYSGRSNLGYGTTPVEQYFTQVGRDSRNKRYGIDGGYPVGIGVLRQGNLPTGIPARDRKSNMGGDGVELEGMKQLRDTWTFMVDAIKSLAASSDRLASSAELLSAHPAEKGDTWQLGEGRTFRNPRRRDSTANTPFEEKTADTIGEAIKNVIKGDKTESGELKPVSFNSRQSTPLASLSASGLNFSPTSPAESAFPSAGSNMLASNTYVPSRQYDISRPARSTVIHTYNT